MLKLFNTLTRKKEIFKPIKKDYVGLYTCGPTVYDYAHIGNFRAYIFGDLLKRYLKYKGFKVKHVMNLTDVDDKTIKGSQKEHTSLDEYTSRYKKAFFEDIKVLNIEKADIYPEATKHIKEMVTLIKILLEKKNAYKSDDGSIYYDVSKFKDYGKLAQLKIKELKTGARVKQDEYEKEEANDFALWKSYSKEDRDAFWETEIGKGRPGWHIECSVMSSKYLGETFDIHTGGVDLIFPHHTNEIAQSEAATEKKFVKYWLHNEHLLVEGKKMSKSLGNFYTLRDLLQKGYSPKAIRLLLLSTHYRQKLNFTFKGVEGAKNSIERLDNFVFNLRNITETKDNPKVGSLIKETEQKFEEKMDDDLNISEALAVIYDFINKIYKLEISKKDAEKIISLMKKFDSILSVMEFDKKDEISDEVKKLIDEREEARKKKEWKKADEIRNELKKKGIELIDTKEGVQWKKKSISKIQY